MGTLKQYELAERFQVAIQEVLEPGEIVEEVADFHMPVPKSAVSLTWVLTQRNLRALSFRGSGILSRSTAVTVAGNFQVPIYQITSFTTGRQGGWRFQNVDTGSVGFLKQEMRSMSFTHAGGRETWWTEYAQGEALIRRVRARLSDFAPTQVGIAEEIEKLAMLRAEGVLDDDEFDRAKQLFIGKRPDQQTEAMKILRQLHSLQQAGVLSPGEFNMKKWDVLARSETRPR